MSVRRHVPLEVQISRARQAAMEQMRHAQKVAHRELSRAIAAKFGQVQA